MNQQFNIRLIQQHDNTIVAKIIRDVMTEFGAVGEGYSINDPEVDTMFEVYNNDKAAFFVIEQNGQVMGCGGIGPLKGGDAQTCELKKMYFYPTIRGFGLGQKLIDTCLEAARQKGYTTCYIETIASMETANRLYVRNGFQLSPKMGNTGHGACNTCYKLKLVEGRK